MYKKCDEIKINGSHGSGSIHTGLGCISSDYPTGGIDTKYYYHGVDTYIQRQPVIRYNIPNVEYVYYEPYTKYPTIQWQQCPYQVYPWHPCPIYQECDDYTTTVITNDTDGDNQSKCMLVDDKVNSQYLVEIEVPGFKEQWLDVNYDGKNKCITIKGCKPYPAEQQGVQVIFNQKEHELNRVIYLPKEIKTKQIRAYKFDGILKIILPYEKQDDQIVKIDIKSR